MTKKTTINDIARIAEVSKKTVSRVINNESGVKKSTRQHVELIIKQENYHPDPQARGLAFKRSFLFALVYDNPNPSFVSEAMSGVLERCRPKGYELVAHPCNMKEFLLVENIISFISRLKIDGIILLPPLSESEALIAGLQAINCNYVRLQSVLMGERNHMVRFNDRKAAADVAEHLISLGHKDIAFIQGPEGHQSAIERYNGFRDTLLESGLDLPAYRIAKGDYTFQSGHECADWFLSMENKPSAIFASNDEMALGVMVAAEKKGMKIPEDISIVGFDDSPHASKVYPALTTVNLRVKEMGQLAAEKLLALCTKKLDAPILMENELTPNFIQRQSTAAPKRGK